MYLWKCWRDTRSTFLSLLGSVLAVGVFGAYVALDPFGWIEAKPPLAKGALTTSADVLLGLTVPLVPIVGFWLGALGVGVEFEKGTADFLLTRPRTRRYLLWTSWAVGATQVVALVLLGSLLQFLRPPGPFQLQGVGDLLRSIAGFGTVALLVYSLTYAMTTWVGHSRNGTGLAILALSAYGGLLVGLRLWYDVRLPIFMDLYSRSYRAGPDFLSAVAGWLAVGLALMLAAQWRFERAEV